MRLSAFCSSGERRQALLLTYSIDPAFFEAVTLQCLVAGGADRIVVIADEGQAREALNAADGIAKLGCRWVLGQSAVAGAFHPKLIARFGPADAKVAVLSGNLTSGGWGRNLELAREWLVGPAHDDAGGWMRELVEAAGRWTRHPVALERLAEIAAIPWLAAARDLPGQPRTVVFSHGERSLFDSALKRWNGRRFAKARILTGSTDPHGALLQRLHDEFGVVQAEIIIEEDRASFLERSLARLPFRPKLRAPTSGGRPLHAKLLHLSGPDGQVCAWGSANCSAAGWINPPAKGGNIEIAVLDDKPSKKETGELFAAFKDARPIEPLVKPRTFEPAKLAPPGLKVDGAFYDARDGRITVIVAAPANAVLVFVIKISDGERQISLSPGRLNGEWIGRIRHADVPANGCLVGRIEERRRGRILESGPLWVDQLSALGRRATDADLRRRHDAISKDVRELADRQRILTDLWSTYDAVMTEPERYHLDAPNAMARRSSQRDAPTERQIQPLDPAQLVREVAMTPRRSPGSSRRDSAVGLSIFESLFYEAPDRPDATVLEGDRDDLDGQDVRPATRPPTGDAQAKKPNTRPGSNSDIDYETRKMIRADFDAYLARLQKLEFLAAVRPANLTGAIFVLLSVACKAARSGWIPPAAAAHMACDVAHALFSNQIAGHRGVIDAYRAGISDAESRAVFEADLGSGRLWAALLSALAVALPKSASTAVWWGSALAQTFRREALFCAADTARLAPLFDAADPQSPATAWFSAAPAVNRAIADLDAAMGSYFDRLFRLQGGGNNQDREHLFWSPETGWRRPIEKGFGSVGRCVSLERAIAASPQIRSFVEAVSSAWVPAAEPKMAAARRPGTLAAAGSSGGAGPPVRKTQRIGKRPAGDMVRRRLPSQ